MLQFLERRMQQTLLLTKQPADISAISPSLFLSIQTSTVVFEHVDRCSLILQPNDEYWLNLEENEIFSRLDV